MSRKHWIPVEIREAAKTQDAKTGLMMERVAASIGKCGSKTIWDLVNRRYKKKCKGALYPEKIKPPSIEEFVDWQGEVGGDEGALKVSGLAYCKKIQCPSCCYVRSLIRRNLALRWAEAVDWSGFYAVALTFTVPHKLDDSSTPRKFKPVMENLFKSADAFRTWFQMAKRQDGRGYHSTDPESLGYMSSLEFTFGKNGLHPHWHTLFFTKSEADIAALKKWFRRDRVRVWKASSAFKRMPAINEDKSFVPIVNPSEGNVDKVLSYINKGLFETLSVMTKEKVMEGGKLIFNLYREELVYFCTFFEATKGRRFYRSGGICRQISSLKAAKEEALSTDVAVGKKLHSIVRLAKKEGLAEGLVSLFVSQHQKELEKKAVALSSFDIKKLVEEEWMVFLNSQINGFRNML